MDEKHKELLDFHRPKFIRTIEPDRLSTILKTCEVFNEKDVFLINEQISKNSKVEMLLDILPTKGVHAFQHFCHALETTYPHLLTLMFLGFGGATSVGPGGSPGPPPPQQTGPGGPSATAPTSGPPANNNNNNLKDSFVPSHPDQTENNHRHANPSSTDNIPPSSNQASKTYTKLIPTYKYELNSPASHLPLGSTDKNSHSIVHSSPNAPSNTTTSPTTSTGNEISNECHSIKTKHSEFHFAPKVSHSQQNKDYRLSLNGDRILERQRDYELLKMQYERALTELQSMRRQHVDSIKDVDTYQANYVSGRTHMSQKCDNIENFKTQNLNKNPQVERIDFSEKSDILDIRKQHSEIERGSSEGVGKMSENSVRAKYDALKKDYDLLHQRYSELLNQHAVTCSDLEKVSIEIGQTQKSYNEACSDRDNALSERNTLQQQCTTALRNWNASIQEISGLKGTLDLLTHQREKQKKESQQTVAINMQMKKDLETVSRERDAALREYTLIMSERDSVHKEIEQQQDRIAEATKCLETFETEKKTFESKIKKLQSQASELLADRDKAIEDYSTLYQKYNEMVSKQKQENSSHGEFHSDYPLLTREHREFSQCQTLAERDLMVRESYDSIQLEKNEEIVQGVCEADNLRKQAEKLQHELDDALQEAELSKKRRDWAFDERNKIVQERESVKNLCDSLRRDRDRAVSDLAQALRDSDELKKQKNEACKEFKELKEKYDLLVEKDSRKNQLNSVGQNQSRDSAIDTDMVEWETETLQIDISGLDMNNLGFELIGGLDDPQFSNDSSIIISHISKGSAAEGKLKVNDIVLRVNNIDMTNVQRKVVLEAIFNTPGIINMVVRRRRSMARLWQPVHISMSSLKEKGVQLETGLFISHLSSGSLLTKDGQTLIVGDRINQINGQNVSCKSVCEVMKILHNSPETVVLDVWRQTTSPANSTGSSPTPNCQQTIRLLHDQSLISAAMSDRSCNEADKDPLWDSGMEESKDSKTVRHNGSQTDSLDSPRPLHRKNNKSSNQKTENRSRYSTSDKFLEKAWEFFKKGRHSKYTSREEHNASRDEADEVIAEFDAIVRFHDDGDDGQEKKKSPLDHENSGTWPKYRGMETNTTNQGTVISSMSSQKRKDRPPLSAILNNSSLARTPASPPPTLSQSGLYNKKSHPSFAPRSPQGPEAILSNKSLTAAQILNAKALSTLNPHLTSSVPSAVTKDQFQANIPDTRTLPLYSAPVHSSPSTLDRTLGEGYSKGLRPKINQNKYEKRFYPPPLHQLQGSHQMPPTSQLSSTGTSVTKSSDSHSFHIQPSAWSFTPSLPSSVSPTTDSLPANKYRMSPTVGIIPPTRPQSVYSNSLPSQMTMSPRPASQVQFYQVSSQRVPPQGGVASVSTSVTSSSTPISSHFQSSLSPRHPSQSYMTTSIPEMESDSLHYHRQNKEFHHFKENSTGVKSLNKMSVKQRPILGTSSIMKQQKTAQSLKNVEKWLTNISTSSNNVERSTPTPSEDFPYNCLHSRYPLHSREIQELNGCSTFPKHGHERIRIPSNTSVATKSSAGRISTSSAEVVSERSSPMSPIHFPFERSSTPSFLPPPNLWVHPKPGKKPNIGDTRHISIEMTSEPVGFKIDSVMSGGIFVCSVSENSLASEHGLFVGDQLLEVCGINMRVATYQLAASVLRQCRENISMLVQYNPKKYKTEMNSHSSSSPPPPSSPKSSSKSNHRVSSETLVPTSMSSGNLLHRMSTISSPETTLLPSNQHCIILDKPKSTSSLGLSLTGGQGGIGVFVDDVQGNSLLDGINGIARGYQILEYNGMNLRYATVEQARNELSKPTSSVKIISQYNPEKVTLDQSLIGGLHRRGYLKCRFSTGGPFFVRSLFDHHPTEGELSDLSFSKTDVLFVKDVCRGVLVTEKDENGNSYWFAWLLNHQGKKIKYGRIPTKLSPGVDLKRSSSESLNLPEDELKYSRRGSGTVRRSFFKRKKHQRTNSRDSRDLSSFSEISLNANSLSISEDGLFSGFTKVEKKESQSIRPVVFLTPLAKALIKKLISESPDKYCQNDSANSETLDKSSAADGSFLEFQKTDNFYESITRICDNDCHCLLNVNPSVIERLHRIQIYPIVIFVRHKNSKQIRETKDVQFLPEKISNKSAKELFEQFQKIEQDYRHYISASIPGGNLAEMCMQIKRVIDIEQKKVIFIPCSSSF